MRLSPRFAGEPASWTSLLLIFRKTFRSWSARQYIHTYVRTYMHTYIPIQLDDENRWTAKNGAVLQGRSKLTAIFTPVGVLTAKLFFTNVIEQALLMGTKNWIIAFITWIGHKRNDWIRWHFWLLYRESKDYETTQKQRRYKITQTF